jgi:protein-S-isoprenylcysteine O-methyltransferase Ste14
VSIRNHRFELRIPPPAVVAIAAALMWGIAAALPSLRVDVPRAGLIAALCVALGILVAGAGLLAFRRARTTANPMRPEAATRLVTSGVYGWTRNPMYLGWLPILAGWAAYLQHPLSLLVVPLFMLYLTRFQIVPEERALSAKFGEQFDAYRQRVRRWL